MRWPADGPDDLTVFFDVWLQYHADGANSAVRRLIDWVRESFDPREARGFGTSSYILASSEGIPRPALYQSVLRRFLAAAQSRYLISDGPVSPGHKPETALFSIPSRDDTPRRCRNQQANRLLVVRP